MTMPVRLDEGLDVALSPTSLTILGTGLSFDELEQAVGRALRLGDAARWWLGDLLLFGDANFGEMYAQLLDSAAMSERQAERYRYVAEKVAPSRRRENLSFSHHEQVAAMEPPDQERLLALAEVGQMSVASLREAIKDHKAFQSAETDGGRRQIVLPPSEVDAARGVREVRETLRQVAERIESPELREATGIDHSMRALDHVGRTVRRAGALEPLALAVAAVIAAGVRQSGLPDPAVIVPAGPWDTLVAAYASAAEGGKA
jgi:hypothetical protein